MSTDKNGGGVFDYEGGDMEYLVEWELDDGAMYCEVFIVSGGVKINVNDKLYDAIMGRIYDLAWDYYWERGE